MPATFLICCLQKCSFVSLQNVPVVAGKDCYFQHSTSYIQKLVQQALNTHSSLLSLDIVSVYIQVFHYYKVLYWIIKT